MAELSILEAIRSALDEEMERDSDVMVLGEDVGKKGGVFGATEGLFAKYGEKRVLDTPLSEGMIAGAAAGAAIYGLRPVAEMEFADFVYPAFKQIVSEISRMRYRSNGAFGLPMVISMPYGGGVHGANRFGGFGAEVAATIAQDAFEHLDGPVMRLAGPEVPGVPYQHALEEWFMLDPEKIVTAARELAA